MKPGKTLLLGFNSRTLIIYILVLKIPIFGTLADKISIYLFPFEAYEFLCFPKDLERTCASSIGIKLNGYITMHALNMKNLFSSSKILTPFPLYSTESGASIDKMTF